MAFGGSGIKFSIDVKATELASAVLDMRKPVAHATTEAIVRAGRNVVSHGAADISRGVRSKKLPKSWSARYFPGKSKGRPQRESVDAAVFTYSKVSFMTIFEDGGTVRGKPYLWIPLQGTPAFVGKGLTRAAITPQRAEAQGIKLFSIAHPGKRPLLAAKINASRSVAQRGRVLTPTLKRLRSSRGKATVTIPLFFGVKSVTIKKKFHLGQIANREADQLENYYAAALKED